jgi:hypothetical protein
MQQKRAKARGKAKKASAAEEDSPSKSVVWHFVKKVQTVKLSQDTAYLDSGALHHMIANRSLFSTYLTDAMCKIELADGQIMTCAGKGTIYIKIGMGQ